MPGLAHTQHSGPDRAQGRIGNVLTGNALNSGARIWNSQKRNCKLVAAGLLCGVLMSIPLQAANAQTAAVTPSSTTAAEMTRELFLDRLMIAELDGRDTAANPKSTAVGAFQFIEDTFIYLVERHFAAETAGLGRTEILALRSDRAFARKVADVYTTENADFLRARGAEPSYPHLRLAFLLGPSGAARVITATPVAHLLSESSLKANTFLARMTAADLIARAAWDISPERAAGKRPPAGGHGIAVKCNLKLPSCKRWLALEQRKLKTGRKGNSKTAKKSAAAQ